PPAWSVSNRFRSRGHRPRADVPSAYVATMNVRGVGSLLRLLQTPRCELWRISVPVQYPRLLLCTLRDEHPCELPVPFVHRLFLPEVRQLPVALSRIAPHRFSAHQPLFLPFCRYSGGREKWPFREPSRRDRCI